MQISDLTCKVLQQYSFPTNTEQEIDSKLQSGVYIIKAISSEGNILLTEKLIVQ